MEQQATDNSTLSGSSPHKRVVPCDSSCSSQGATAACCSGGPHASAAFTGSSFLDASCATSQWTGHEGDSLTCDCSCTSGESEAESAPRALAYTTASSGAVHYPGYSNSACASWAQAGVEVAMELFAEVPTLLQTEGYQHMQLHKLRRPCMGTSDYHQAGWRQPQPIVRTSPLKWPTSLTPEAAAWHQHTRCMAPAVYHRS